METIHDFLRKDNFISSIGIKLESATPEKAVATMTVSERHLNAGGVCQGGAIFTLADLAVAATANAAGNLAFTMQADIRYLHTAPLGATLIATSTEVMTSHKVAHYRAEVSVADAEEPIAIVDAICYKK